MKTTKIDWCDSTLNPVIGCKHGCKYCYARKMNARFGWIKDFAKPQFFPERLKQLYSKTPKTIFMDSMSDIVFWKLDWVKIIVKAIADNPQHFYIFLTKGDGEDVYRFHLKFIQIQVLNNAVILDRVAIGRSITGQPELFTKGWNDGYSNDFYSIEPILKEIDLNDYNRGKKLKAIIIGAETGNRKGKVIPKKEWIDKLVKQADERGCQVFMKESLRELMGADFRQDKLYWFTAIEVTR